MHFHYDNYNYSYADRHYHNHEQTLLLTKMTYFGMNCTNINFQMACKADLISFFPAMNSSDTKKQDETQQGILTNVKLFNFFIIIIIVVTRVFRFHMKYSMKISSL